MKIKCSKILQYGALEIVAIYFSLLMVMSLLTGNLVYRRNQSLLAAAIIVVLTSHLYSDRRKYFITWGALGTLLASVLYIYYNLNDSSQVYLAIKYLSFSLNESCLIILTVSMLWQQTKKIISVLLLILALIIPIVFWGYYLSMDAWFASDTLLAVMQTNLGESKEYLSDYFTVSGMAAIIFIVIVAGIVWRNMQSVLLVKEKKHFTAFISLALLVSATACYKTRDNLILNTGWKAKENLQKYADFQKMQAQRKSTVRLNLQENGKQQGVFVLVIGESQSKDHMSAYGYDKKTTPWLGEAFKQDNFIKFTNAYSCHTHTVPVLTYALTAKNQYNELQLENAVSLLEVAEAAGYETAWLSNQIKYSAWDTPITVIASEANQQDWINHNIGETTVSNAYDLKLLDSLKSLKLTDKMLIVIHLMGNHGSYRERYPRDFAVFSDMSSEVGSYDNSILYNDYVVSKIYEYVRSLPEFNCMIYFADHADAVEEKLGHDAGKFVWPMTHIPMYIGFSERFRQKDAAMVNILRNSQDKVFTNDLIFNIMLGLMNIKIPDIYEQENDITSTYYNSDIQRFKTLYGQRFVREDLQ